MSMFSLLSEELFSLVHSNHCLYNFRKSRFNLKHLKLYSSIKSGTCSGPSSKNVLETVNCKHVPFEQMIMARRNEARRSIGVQVQSESSFNDLYTYCDKLAPINSMFHYELENKHYFLIEFTEDCDQVLRKCVNNGGTGVVPAKSPFVWFKASKHGGKLQNFPPDVSLVNKLPLKFSMVPTQEQMIEWIEHSCSLSDSIKVLYEGSRLDELGTRLRLLTARQLEMALEGLFPSVAVLPFGSSVNGLGKTNCDLDLVLQQDYPLKESSSNSFRLVYHTKSAGCAGSSRLYVQRQMEVLADLIQLYMPGCNSVKRILQARVPIVKFSQEVTGVDCDLSMTNLTGVHMSELLYAFGCLDPLARPLVFSIKQWAWASGLTNPTPGPWITNFTLTLLTFFYLQMIHRLPSVDFLKAAADTEDKRVTEDIDCTFVRDLSRLKWDTKSLTNYEDLSILLRGFFNYYSGFDFATAGISLNTGSVIPKLDFSPLYVMNPLEQSANVSKNVKLEEVERLKIALRDAAWNFESTNNDQKLFINLITKSSTLNERSPKKFISRSRMVSVKHLFTDR